VRKATIDEVWDFARSSGRQAGNESMVKARRKVWSRADLLASRRDEDLQLAWFFTNKNYATVRQNRGIRHSHGF